jgi:hypothetical protein
MIMYLKTLYPQHFHCLRGNHDDMACELARDFTKFVGLKYKDDELVLVDGQVVKTGDRGEARLIKDWVLARAGWGEPFLNHWSLFERSLPLLARSSYFVVSHTLPLIPLTEDAIRDRERPREITIELTSRRGIQEEAIRGTLNNLGLQETIQRWFYGHSPVPASSNNGRFEEGLDGLLVRFNNPRNYVFAYVPSTHEERRFQADSDVYIKTPTEETFHQ